MSTSEKKPILSAKGIIKIFSIGRTSELEVLKGIDLKIVQGEILAIIGPSGVGKSTLLHILGTLDRSTRGKVILNNTDVFRLNDMQLASFRNKMIGFVFQFHHLMPEFTALENVAIPGLIARSNKREVYIRSRQLLDEVGLKDRLHHKPRELSGGEQQRVAFARSLINDPTLILADEPSGNLDLKNSNTLHELIWKLVREKQKTFVVVTHNKELAKKADRIVELLDGKINQDSRRNQSAF
jgi:lipoprotein-releasing system ATP-binding protein